MLTGLPLHIAIFEDGRNTTWGTTYGLSLGMRGITFDTTTCSSTQPAKLLLKLHGLARWPSFTPQHPSHPLATAETSLVVTVTKQTRSYGTYPS